MTRRRLVRMLGGGLLFTGIVVSPSIAYWVEYLRGRGFLPVPADPIIYPTAMLLLSALPVLVGCVALLTGIVLLSKRKRLALALIGASFLLFIVAKLLDASHGDFDPFLRGYASRIGSELDLRALQQWSVDVLHAKPVPQYDLTDKLTEYLAVEIFTHAYAVSDSDVYQPHLKLAEGGHFIGYWGVRVGAEGLECKETQREKRISAGICVWRQSEQEYDLRN